MHLVPRVLPQEMSVPSRMQRQASSPLSGRNTREQLKDRAGRQLVRFPSPRSEEPPCQPKRRHRELITVRQRRPPGLCSHSCRPLGGVLFGSALWASPGFGRAWLLSAHRGGSKLPSRGAFGEGQQGRKGFWSKQLPPSGLPGNQPASPPALCGEREHLGHPLRCFASSLKQTLGLSIAARFMFGRK